MVNIKKLNFFDKPKLKELSTFLNHEDRNLFVDLISNGLPGRLQYYLPLKFKILNESFLLTDNDRTLGLITAGTFNGNPYKINIAELCFIENAYEVAQQLVEFVISQYGAMGAHTFFILTDETLWELCQLFVNRCGFREIGSEEIWKVKKSSIRKERKIKYRRFRKSDVKEIADIYNYSLYPHLKPTLLRTEAEFCEPLLLGLKYANEYRYVIEDLNTSKITAYFKISTADNKNYMVDFNYSDGYDVDFNSIIYFAKREIHKRTKNYKLYVKLKNYINTNQAQKDYFINAGFKWIKTKKLFVKDFFKILKEYSPEERFAVLGELSNSPSY